LKLGHGSNTSAGFETGVNMAFLKDFSFNKYVGAVGNEYEDILAER